MGYQDPLADDLSQRFERGLACIERSKPAEALEHFNAVLEANPACERVLCGRGTALRLLGRLTEARQDYEAALALDPNYPRAYFNRGLARFEQGEIEEALADFDVAIRLQAEPGFFYHRGNCLLQLERFVDAISDFDQVIRLDPDKPHTYFQRGVAHAKLDNASAACRDFDIAISRDHMKVQAFSWKAYCQSLLNEPAEAVKSIDVALSLEPDNLDLLVQRANALCATADYESAVVDFDRCLRHQSDRADLYYCRGLAWKNLRDYDAAIADFNASINLQQENANPFWARGDAYLDLGDFDQALADLSRAIELEPTADTPFYLRARTWHALGNDFRAMADLNQALAINPKNKYALRTRCALFVELGDNNPAESDLDTLAQLELQTLQELDMHQRKTRLSMLLAEHFAPESIADLAITVRKFPFRVRADLQRAVDRLFDSSTDVLGFFGVKRDRSYESMMFSDLLYADPHNAALAVPPEYEELDIGEAEPIRCLKNGIWLLKQDDQKFAMLLAPAIRHGEPVGMQFQIAVMHGPQGVQVTQRFYKHLEDAVAKSESYRGKILSLELRDHYSGMSSRITVHKLRTVDREQVILPQSTLDLLDRNIVEFARQRSRLAEVGLSTKKGLLFYGPPGTGKTHTIHYLAGAMTAHTTLLITAEQVGLLGEYMTLARLLQPSIVVIEDADLIARDRNSMESACEEVLLNKLLNEMDGLRPDSDVFFILTTNRPEALEAALASRPGRIDQAIEFPLPDEEGRRKLISLYSRGLSVPADVADATVKKTERASASFIKELMRRAAQFHFERNGSNQITSADIDQALHELLFAGGVLNRSLLGMQSD